MNENCLPRKNLGVRRPTRSKSASFTLRNFELDLQIVDNLELEMEYFAREMVRALAVMHWRCKVSYFLPLILSIIFNYGI